MDVLKVLWDRGPGPVREIQAALLERGRHWAYTTVLTLLQRLQAKGYAASDRRPFAHIFSAAVSREELLGLRLRHMADQVCDGESAPLVLALVKGQRFSSEEIAQFRRLLDDREGGSRKLEAGRGKKK
jgi:predicted transcriptional regulator